MIRKALAVLGVSAAAVLSTAGVASAAAPVGSPPTIDVTTNGQPAPPLTGLTANTNYDVRQCFQTVDTVPSGSWVVSTFCNTGLTAITDAAGNFPGSGSLSLILGPLGPARTSLNSEVCGPAGTPLAAGQTLHTTCFLHILETNGGVESNAKYITLNYPGTTTVPETPYAVILPLAGLGVLGLAYLIVRNRRAVAA
jgi:hypothetical protein